MTYTFPRFDEPTWSAVFESYDQRKEDVYYVITLPSGGMVTARIAVWWAGDDWTGPEFTERLRDELHAIVSAA